MLGAIQHGDLEQTNPFDLKSIYFYTSFRARERWCSAGIPWVRHEYFIVGESVSADKKVWKNNRASDS